MGFEGSNTVYNMTANQSSADEALETGQEEPSVGGLLVTKPHITLLFLCIYGLIFLVGVFGNVLVIYVVARYKAMRTITNRFIACLSISDLLISIFAIPFTPLNALSESWAFGKFLCQFVPIVQVVSVFVSTLTSVAIALDRYIVIIHPHTPRMSFKVQIFVILAIWTLASSTAIPTGVYTTLICKDGSCYCQEQWPNNYAGDIYTWVVFVFQFVLPSIVISACYITVSIRLNQRTKARIGKRDYHKERMEASRNRRVNRMLIAMITIFIACWLPLNLFHITKIRMPESQMLILFLSLHIVAMSSVIYNPFLYGWMNENFNAHFRELWRYFKAFFYKNSKSSSSCDSPTTEIVLTPTRDNSDQDQLRDGSTSPNPSCNMPMPHSGKSLDIQIENGSEEAPFLQIPSRDKNEEN